MFRKEGCRLKRFLILLLCAYLLLSAGIAEGSGVIQFLTGEDPRPELSRNDLLEVHFLSVKAADSILLRMGSHAILVDSGSKPTYQRITSYLETVGVNSLDYVIETHPHNDHIGGFFDIISLMPVGAYYQPRLYEDYRNTVKKQLSKLLAERHIPVIYLENEQQMFLGGAKLTFYQWQKVKATVNDRSMMIKVEYGSRSILLAADVESRAQLALAESYGEALKADIIKFPHHAIAPLKNAFHNAVQPAFAVITNGKSKVKNAAKALERMGTLWLATSQGTIVAICDGRQWRVWQEAPPTQ